jgi:hypothetical protein
MGSSKDGNTLLISSVRVLIFWGLLASWSRVVVVEAAVVSLPVTLHKYKKGNLELMRMRRKVIYRI